MDLPIFWVTWVFKIKIKILYGFSYLDFLQLLEAQSRPQVTASDSFNPTLRFSRQCGRGGGGGGGGWPTPQEASLRLLDQSEIWYTLLLASDYQEWLI